MPAELAPAYYPKVPIWRRGAALAIDFLAIGLLSLLIGGSIPAQAFVFIAGWLAMRVLLVARNRGQSLGRWALDMKIVDARIGGTPGLLELTKREGAIGLGALLVLWGLVNLSPAAPGAVMLFIPLAIDCSLAFVDRQQQALHDQFSQTRVVQTRRGYSLDLKLRKLFAYAQRRMK
jgi:uncharacterized RDD family membrane protein YckC